MPHESFLEPDQTSIKLPADESPQLPQVPKLSVPKLSVPKIHITQEKVKHTSKQFLIWSIAIGVFFGAGIVIFFFLHRPSDVKTASLPLAAQEPASPTIMPSPLPTPQQQLFSDSRIGFTLSYPSSWEKPVITEGNLQYSVDFGHGFSIMQLSNKALNQQSGKSYTLSQWVANEYATLQKQKTTSQLSKIATTVTDIPASKISYHNSLSGDMVTEVLLAHDESIIIATFTIASDNQEQLDSFNSILATLTFPSETISLTPTIGL